MWTAIISTIVVFMLAVLGMAIGAILGNRSLRGSCGGTANKDPNDMSCDFCNSGSKECRSELSGEGLQEDTSPDHPELVH